jgi:fibronectin-binding autotransporter adhesin
MSRQMNSLFESLFTRKSRRPKHSISSMRSQLNLSTLEDRVTPAANLFLGFDTVSGTFLVSTIAGGYDFKLETNAGNDSLVFSTTTGAVTLFGLGTGTGASVTYTLPTATRSALKLVQVQGTGADDKLELGALSLTDLSTISTNSVGFSYRTDVGGGNDTLKISGAVKFEGTGKFETNLNALQTNNLSSVTFTPTGSITSTGTTGGQISLQAKNAGTISMGANAIVSVGAVLISADTVDINGSLAIQANANDITIQAATAGTLTSTAVGIAAINTVGTVLLNAGNFTSNSVDVISDSATVDVNSGVIWNVTANDTIGGLTGDGIINGSAGATLLTNVAGGTSKDYNGTISGNNFIFGTAATQFGTQGLNNFSSYTGGTNINSGILVLRDPDAAGTGAINIGKLTTVPFTSGTLAQLGLESFVGTLPNALIFNSTAKHTNGIGGSPLTIKLADAADTIVLSGAVTLNLDTDIETSVGNVQFTNTIGSAAGKTNQLRFVQAVDGTTRVEGEIGDTLASTTLTTRPGEVNTVGFDTISEDPGNFEVYNNVYAQSEINLSTPTKVSGTVTMKAFNAATGNFFLGDLLQGDAAAPDADLTIEARNVQLQGLIGSPNRLGSLTVNATSKITLAKNVSTKDSQIYDSANLAMQGDAILLTNGGTGQDITITAPITGNTFSLQLLAGPDGNVTLGGDVTNLTSFDVYANTFTLANVTTLGSQTYRATNQINLNKDTTLTSSGFGQVINFIGDVFDNNGWNLILDALNGTLDATDDITLSQTGGILRILNSNSSNFRGLVTVDEIDIVDTTSFLPVQFTGGVDVNLITTGTDAFSITLSGGTVGATDFNHIGYTELGGIGQTLTFTTGINTTPQLETRLRGGTVTSPSQAMTYGATFTQANTTLSNGTSPITFTELNSRFDSSVSFQTTGATGNVLISSGTNPILNTSIIGGTLFVTSSSITSLGSITAFTGVNLNLLGTTPSILNTVTTGGQLQKSGRGRLVLNGSNNAVGGTVVNSGDLIVNGVLSGTTLVKPGAFLGGNGVVSNTIVQGTISAGTSPGNLTTGNLTLDGNGRLLAELSGTNSGTYDSIFVNGTVNLGGATLDTRLLFSSQIGDQFRLIQNDGTDAVTGTFAGLAEGTLFQIGNGFFTITYQGGDGNDVVLQTQSISGPPVPPPPPPVVINLPPLSPSRAIAIAAGPFVQAKTVDGTASYIVQPLGAAFTGTFVAKTGDLDGDGRFELVVAVASGAPPLVFIYSSLGTLQSVFYAYAPTFNGGVTLALGDLNGDGKDEIITGTGRGSSHVRIFDGTTLGEVASFFAFDAGMQAGVNLAAGDLDGDGKDELLTVAGAGMAPHVKVFDGQTFAMIKSFFAVNPGFFGGVNLSVGDLDGDGKGEIVTSTAAGLPLIQIANSDGVSQKVFYAYSGPTLGGANAAVKDVNGDGKSEIVTGTSNGLPGHVKVFNPANFDLIDNFFAISSVLTYGAYVG